MGLPPELLTLEITESAVMADPEVAIPALERLRDMGIRLSVDDYGTGRSTMTYLKRLPAHEVKIDKSFVQGIGVNRSDLILVRSTIDMAHELGFKVVAEGVEDAACLATLGELGCDVVQGWHTGRPMPAEDYIRFVRGPALGIAA
jgi:EAL domain-containing protein (putative c-di-GMP-specific phosphodiesterase class I)